MQFMANFKNLKISTTLLINLHAIQLTYLKCAVIQFLVYSQRRATYYQSVLEHFHQPEEEPYIPETPPPF